MLFALVESPSQNGNRCGLKVQREVFPSKLIGELEAVSYLLTFQLESGTMRLRDLSRTVYTTQFHLALHEKN